MKRGISLLIVSIMIIVMFTLVTIVVINGSNIIKKTDKSKLEAELTQIKKLTQNYIARNSQEVDFDEVTISISGLSAEEQAQYSGETITGGNVTLYEIDLNKIDASEVTYGDKSEGETDRYLYSTVTKKVYYEKGVTIDNVVYHTI